MSKKHISEVMQPPHSISFSANVEEAVREMSSIETDALLIRQNEEYSGIFTKTDLIKILKKISTLQRSLFPLLCQNLFSLSIWIQP